MEEDKKEKALLVGVDTGEDTDFERSMEELASLAEACNMQVAGLITQKLSMVNKALYIGSGKIAEVRDFARDIEADVVVFDNALSPSQLRNLQNELEKPILDRTTLILDIFSTRAQTREAKLQVETARLQYLLPRLVGMRAALSRQGGASGSMSNKGAGEKKLELDRRRIEHRLSELRKELDEVAQERVTQRKKRLSSRIPKVSLVGYTNAGKSTILNHMVEKYLGEEDKKVLEKDMLFATLETTVRKIETGNNQDFLLSDTVGFIHKLPHGLIKAFRSTLEEVKNADLLLHVIDYSDEHYKQQMAVTEETLQELEAGDIPVIYVFNKTDKCTGEGVRHRTEDNRIYMSAQNEQDIEELVWLIIRKLYASHVNAEFLIPYAQGQITSYFMENARVDVQEYREDGVYLKVNCNAADRGKYQNYLLF
ncbi:MAG: GTPase HflX [Clostridiales bacterium]|nr:GTPase HflX [Clostridiales bacterium]